MRKFYPNISLDTVNRNLLAFEKLGVIRIVEGSGQPKKFDADLTPHYHFRCLLCFRIIDVHECIPQKIELPPNLKKQFTILNKTVYLEGVCNKCKKRKVNKVKTNKA